MKIGFEIKLLSWLLSHNKNTEACTIESTMMLLEALVVSSHIISHSTSEERKTSRVKFNKAYWFSCRFPPNGKCFSFPSAGDDATVIKMKNCIESLSLLCFNTLLHSTFPAANHSVDCLHFTRSPRRLLLRKSFGKLLENEEQTGKFSFEKLILYKSF